MSSLLSHQLARERMLGLRLEAERATLARRAAAAQRLESRARRATARAARAHAELELLYR